MQFCSVIVDTSFCLAKIVRSCRELSQLWYLKSSEQTVAICFFSYLLSHFGDCNKKCIINHLWIGLPVHCGSNNGYFLHQWQCLHYICASKVVFSGARHRDNDMTTTTSNFSLCTIFIDSVQWRATTTSRHCDMKSMSLPGADRGMSRGMKQGISKYIVTFWVKKDIARAENRFGMPPKAHWRHMKWKSWKQKTHQSRKCVEIDCRYHEKG